MSEPTPAQVRAILSHLTHRERQMVTLLFGLEDGYRYQRDEVAAMFKISRTRVGKIERKALDRISMTLHTKR